MRAREYANWDNPRFAPLKEPVRRVMDALREVIRACATMVPWPPAQTDV